MISEKKNKPKTLAVLLVLALAVLFTFQMNPVLADTPDVTNVEWWTDGMNTYLNITVEHASPDSTHYVDLVEVDYPTEGRTEDIDLGPQSTETFFAEYNLGVVDEYYEPVVSVRASCTVHGAGSWTDHLTVPEFSTLSLLLILAIVSIAVLLFRFNARARSIENAQIDNENYVYALRLYDS